MKPKNRLVPWLFSTPALAIYIFTVLVPVVWSMVYSFFDYNGVSNMNFVGLDNYFQLFQDKVFKTSVMNNLIFMAISTVFQLFMGLLLATILTSITKGNNSLRVAYFIPCIISSMAICQIFVKLLSVQPEGVLAALMKAMGMAPVAVLSDPKLALLVVSIIDGYKFCGIYMVIFYSAFLSVDQEVIEAAYIDGCSWWQSYCYIKLPMIKNIFFVVLVLLVNGTLKGFDISYILTSGGPGTSSELVATYLYKTAFSSMKYGYGSTIAVFLVVECLLAVGIVRFIASRTERE